ncbi:MAG TPA: helix-hairpin-helix domain-containing protein [Thermoanaerobaculia bacterium]|nr:helix-hairpin-helix domain-containing protein [Thermoanaerobaculia bacterium]
MRKSLPIFTLALLLTALASAAIADDAAPAVSGVVNINTASANELTLLPRVGEKGAQRILDYRKEHGAFKKTADLMQVKGIGAKTFELMSPYLAVDGKTTLSEKVHTPRKPRAKKPATPASN